MPIGFYSVGGSKGRPTGPELRGCIINPKTGNPFIVPCTPVRIMRWPMIMTNDWYYQKGNINSTTGGATTGGIMRAKKRRT